MFGLWRCVAPALLVAVFASPVGSGEAQQRAEALPEPADPAVRRVERKALSTFFDALGGPDWIQRDFWGTDEPVGRWHGVETDADGHVVKLAIYDNNLVGAVPPAICDLKRLNTLHLSFNKIAGPLPDGLGRCRALKNLWLKGNKLEGLLPPSVATLPALEYLDVHANNLAGPLPERWDTPQLTIFRGEDNQFSGSLPDTLFRQPQLKQVFLHNNTLSETLPDSLPGAINLHSLLLSKNALSGSIPSGIGLLPKLTDLRLNRNKLTGPIPESLSAAIALQVLRLDHNELSGTIPPGLAERLIVFDASHNPDLKPGP